MPPKEKPRYVSMTIKLKYEFTFSEDIINLPFSKKAVKAKQEKVIEDSTFGLKNKNKSKKVQQFIDRVEKTVKNSNGAGDAVCRLLCL